MLSLKYITPSKIELKMSIKNFFRFFGRYSIIWTVSLEILFKFSILIHKFNIFLIFNYKFICNFSGFLMSFVNIWNSNAYIKKMEHNTYLNYFWITKIITYEEPCIIFLSFSIQRKLFYWYYGKKPKKKSKISKN